MSCIDGREAVKNTSQIAIIAAVALTCIAACAWSATADDTARIGLTYFGSPRHVVLLSTGGLNAIKTDSGAALTCNPVPSISVNATKNCLSVTFDTGPVDAGTSVTITPADPAGVITIETSGHAARKYRGSVEIDLAGESVRLINVVNIEDYLAGVVPSEMPESYPVEALKAQAIAARTYLLANKKKHASEGFDICDSDHCQSYGGVLAEKTITNSVVADTRGEVLIYDGRPASVMYSTDCGGVTRNYADTQPDCRAPYLTCVVEPDDIKHMTWEKSYSLSDLEKKLVTAGVKEAAGLKSITVAETDTSGRAVDLTVTGGTTTKTVPVSKLRAALGADVIKSTLFTIEQSDEGIVTIKGRGWGHGVGLCQVGARGLALPPHNLTCDQILAHYFPGTQISGEPKLAPTVPGADVAMVPMPAPKQIIVEPVKNARPPAVEPAKPVKKSEKEPFDVRLRDPWSP